MKNSLTKHASKRIRQRGITKNLLSCVIKHGTVEYSAGGATKTYLTRRDANKAISELKRNIRSIERAAGKSIIEKEGKILTVYHGI